jgi:hypothetical protein
MPQTPKQFGHPLAYADPLRVAKPANPERLLYVALACGVLPMPAGTAAIVGWFATRSGAFAVFGFLTILPAAPP